MRNFMTHHPSTEELQQALRFERLQASLMSLICGLLLLFALAAATHIPDYLAEPDYFRLIGAIFFNLLALAGLAANSYHHLCLRQVSLAVKLDKP